MGAQVRVAVIAAAVVGSLAVAGIGVFIALQPREVVNAAELNSAVASSRSTASTSANKKTAVFIGDSYTHGTGSTDDAHRWTDLLSDAQGWRQVNLGRGGTGYLTTSSTAGCGREYCPNYAEMIPAAVAVNPAVVVVAGGQNDLVLNTDEVVAQVAKTYSDLRAALPDAQIVNVGPSVVGSAGAKAVALDSAVELAAAATGATYISLLQPDIITPGMATPDGGHVDNTGHIAIANAIQAALG